MDKDIRFMNGERMASAFMHETEEEARLREDRVAEEARKNGTFDSYQEAVKRDNDSWNLRLTGEAFLRETEEEARDREDYVKGIDLLRREKEALSKLSFYTNRYAIWKRDVSWFFAELCVVKKLLEMDRQTIIEYVRNPMKVLYQISDSVDYYPYYECKEKYFDSLYKMEQAGSFDIEVMEKYVNVLEEFLHDTEVAFKMDDKYSNDYYTCFGYREDLVKKYGDKIVTMDIFIDHCLYGKKREAARKAYEEAKRRYNERSIFKKIEAIVRGERLFSLEHYTKNGLDSAIEQLDSLYSEGRGK